jgi:hypothetical protein
LVFHILHGRTDLVFSGALLGFVDIVVHACARACDDLLLLLLGGWLYTYYRCSTTTTVLLDDSGGLLFLLYYDCILYLYLHTHARGCVHDGRVTATEATTGRQR